jgi:hypothetical protein
MKRKIFFFMVTILLMFSSTIVPSLAQDASSGGDSVKIDNSVLNRALEIELGLIQPEKYERPVSSGVLYPLLAASGELGKRANAVALAAPVPGNLGPSTPSFGTQGCQNVFIGTGGQFNVRVNQDCSFRRQAEEVVAINPKNSLNLIAGANDNRIGFNHCSFAFSFDGGKTWGDQVPPFWQFQLLNNHTADACSDPTATFDAEGNAYVGGILFNVVSPPSAIVVAKSNAPFGGAFFHTPVPGPFQTYSTFPLGVIANDNNPTIFNDKEFIVADAQPGSPKKNNVYATWTRFATNTPGVGINSPIFFSQSTDGGATWSPGTQISGVNPSVCTIYSGSPSPNACDQDQGSHPVVGTDGTIYVVFSNANTPAIGINQVLFVKCPGTTDCSVAANWTSPARIAALIGTQPRGPAPSTGCPGVSGCLPPNGYRVPEDTSLSISTDNGGNLFAVWSDFRNGGASCTGFPNPGSAATATPPCDNDVFYALSSDGGTTWSSPINIAPASKFGPTAQWQPWSTVSPNGKTLWVAYYDRSYANCEFDGCNDITLAKIDNPASGSPKITYKRLTTSSMPNLIPANNPLQAGFLGDYMWVASDGKGMPYVVWADTRGMGDSVEEDIYFSGPPFTTTNFKP